MSEETYCGLTLSKSAAISVATFAALQRIARKPWPAEHKRVREFHDPVMKRYVKIEVGQHEGWNDPLWHPEWTTKPEMNQCDCPKCIALRALADVKEVVNEHSTSVGQADKEVG